MAVEFSAFIDQPIDLERLRVATSKLFVDLTGLLGASVALRGLEPDAWFD